MGCTYACASVCTKCMCVKEYVTCSNQMPKKLHCKGTAFKLKGSEGKQQLLLWGSPVWRYETHFCHSSAAIHGFWSNKNYIHEYDLLRIFAGLSLFLCSIFDILNSSFGGLFKSIALHSSDVPTKSLITMILLICFIPLSAYIDIYRDRKWCQIEIW